MLNRKTEATLICGIVFKNSGKTERNKTTTKKIILENKLGTYSGKEWII